MGLKTIKMEWDLCTSPPWIPFYPYTMFQYPMPKGQTFHIFIDFDWEKMH